MDEVNLNLLTSEDENRGYDDSPKLPIPSHQTQITSMPVNNNLHLGQMIFNNHNYVHNINMYPSSSEDSNQNYRQAQKDVYTKIKT